MKSKLLALALLGISFAVFALLVGLVSWPLGLVIWLVARPEDKR